MIVGHQIKFGSDKLDEKSLNDLVDSECCERKCATASCLWANIVLQKPHVVWVPVESCYLGTGFRSFNEIFIGLGEAGFESNL